MIIYLIRHGESTDGCLGLTQRADCHLDKTATKNLKTIKKILDKVHFDHIFSSPFPRAEETAKFFFPKKDIQILDYIHEYIRPKCLDKVKREKGDYFWEVEHKDDKFNPDWKFDGGESFSEILQRIKTFSNFLNTMDNYAVIGVVGHGTFFRHLIGYRFMKEEYSMEIFSYVLRKIELQNGGFIILNTDNKMQNTVIKSVNNF